MNTHFTRTVAFLMLALSGGAAPSSFRVVTWNLQWFPGGTPTASDAQRVAHMTEVRPFIEKLKPDILILQEVRNLSATEELLATSPALKVHVVTAFRDAVGGIASEQQICIASRYPCESVWAEPWKRGWAGPPRGFAAARLVVNGQRVQVYGLHLKSNLGDATVNTAKREDAAQQLLEHVSAMRRETALDAVVVAGDFNTCPEFKLAPGEATFEILRQKGFFWTFSGLPFKDRVTAPAQGSYPDACFDQIFCLGLGRPAASVMTRATGSDHLPVYVDAEIVVAR